MGLILYYCNGHPEVGFVVAGPNEYIGQCTYCEHRETLTPVVDDPGMLDLVTAWQRMGHFH